MERWVSRMCSVSSVTASSVRPFCTRSSRRCLLKTRVRDMAAYRAFLGGVLLGLPGVRETRTYAVMEEVKSDGPLPL